MGKGGSRGANSALSGSNLFCIIRQPRLNRFRQRVQIGRAQIGRSSIANARAPQRKSGSVGSFVSSDRRGKRTRAVLTA
jgi:hypothetical protein